MTIIEREIEKREALVKEKAMLVEELARLRDAETAVANKIASIDEVVLNAEIEELKSFLPKPETDVEVQEPTVDEVVEA